jgi:hypothetical protein
MDTQLHRKLLIIFNVDDLVINLVISNIKDQFQMDSEQLYALDYNLYFKKLFKVMQW